MALCVHSPPQWWDFVWFDPLQVGLRVSCHSLCESTCASVLLGLEGTVSLESPVTSGSSHFPASSSIQIPELGGPNLLSIMYLKTKLNKYCKYSYHKNTAAIQIKFNIVCIFNLFFSRTHPLKNAYIHLAKSVVETSPVSNPQRFERDYDQYKMVKDSGSPIGEAC